MDSRNKIRRLKANPGDVFDMFKAVGNVLGDNIAYDTDILNFGTGCWKYNCQDTNGLYFPMVTETRDFNLGSFTVHAVKEINLVPWIAGGLLLYFIMRK